MGWSHGIDERRADGDQDIGYGVAGTCDLPNCETKIHRGLAYVCGGDPFGGEHGCGGFFCYCHLDFHFSRDEEDMSPQLCPECSKLWQKRSDD